MNGVTDQAGKVASGVVEGLKASPVILGLVVLQLLMTGAVLYSSIDRQAAVSAQFTNLHRLLEMCMARKAAP
jgi:uncharacterized membrane protein affecting hemolysin expression